MYLKRLEIFGFKSFGAKSVLDFDNNDKNKISVIVGPNGSGKSNIADAVRWVLGEQSTKLLRSKKNEDVIFCGSSSKPRSSYAEISIVLSNDKEVEVEIAGKKYTFSEIEVSRKLYRSGESEYQINKKKVRLLDIQQLLATLGFGQSSYTVIGQGMVDRLLFFNAAERKVLFDEAAGVKQYEIKREQAVRKLQSTDANLIRLKDILTELEPRVVNLRRLVKRAEGRIEIEKELSEHQNTYYLAIETELKKKISTFVENKDGLNKKIEQLQAQIDNLSREIEGKQDSGLHDKDLSQVEISLGKATQERDSLMQKVANLEASINHENQKFLNAKNELEKFSNDKKSLVEKIAFLTSKIQNEKENLKTEESDLNKEKAKISEYELKKKSLDEKFESLTETDESKKINEFKEKLSDFEKKKRELATTLFAFQQQNAYLENQKKNTEIKKEKLGSDALAISEENNRLRAEVKGLLSQKHNAESSSNELSVTIEKMLVNIKKLENELMELSSGLDQNQIANFEKEIEQAIREHSDLSVENNFDRMKVKSFFVKLKGIFDKTTKLLNAINKDKRGKFEKELSEDRNKLRKHEIELQQNLLLVERLNGNIQRLNDKIEENKEKEKSLHHEIANLENFSEAVDQNKINSIEKEIAKIEFEIGDLQEEIQNNSKNISEKKHEILIVKNQLNDEENLLRKSIYEIELRCNRLKNTLENQERELNSADSKLRWIEGRILELNSIKEAEGSRGDRELDVLKDELVQKNAQLQNLRQKMTEILNLQRESGQVTLELERKRRALENEIMEVRDTLNKIELDQTKYSTRLEDLGEELKVSEIIIDRNSEAKVLDQQGKDALRVKMENLRRRLETIGGVDPETVVEYEELEKRSSEMNTQVMDLEKAKEDLEKVIKELDSRIKKQFSETFSFIANEFNRYFQILFNGGKASLNLGEDEEGNYGIEITANPPGKKVQNLSALSGGERTLTSLALVFAILSINPSPFCILDEVDAALDEANTLRFSKILEDLDCKTQFIVISHNRDTMKVASSLYGITMDTDHISKLISIKLTEALETVS